MKSSGLRILLAVACAFLQMALDASGQAPAKAYRIGVLSMTPTDPRSPDWMAFYEELRQRGYVEGRNLVVEDRNAAGQADRLTALAGELVALGPDLIVAVSPQPNRAVKDATSTIPIVMIAVADPVRVGFAASLARPGGNMTGVSTLVPGGFMAKMLELLRQVVPKETRIAVLVNPGNEVMRVIAALEIPEAARQLGVQIHIMEARTLDEIEPALNVAVGERVEALLMNADPVWNNPPTRLPQLAARSGLPAIYLLRTQAQAGGLMSYGPIFRICSGTRPLTSTVSSKVRNPGTWRSKCRPSSNL